MIESPATSYPANLFVDWALGILKEPCYVANVRSGAHSTVYKLTCNNEAWFLKIADDLTEEIKKLRWLHGTSLPTPKLVAQKIGAKAHAVLISGLTGMDLAELSKSQPNEITVKQLAASLLKFHSTDGSKCPFKAYLPGNVLVHGDACLPNIIYDYGELSGYVDLLDMGVGSVDIDLSAAIWSLQFNLGPGYSVLFLTEYGHNKLTQDEVDRLYDVYENSLIFQR